VPAYPASHTSTFSLLLNKEQGEQVSPSSTGRNEDNEADSRIIAGKIIIKRIKAVTTLFVGINKFFY